MTKTRLLSLVVSFAVALSIIGGGSVPAFADVSTGFEGYASGTFAGSLTIPGVSFSGGAWMIFPSTDALPPFTALTGNTLATPVGVGPLTISFSEPQSSYSFLFALGSGYTPGSLGIQGFLGGTQVFSATFSAVSPAPNTFPEGAAAGSGVTFDTLVIPLNSRGVAIDNLVTSSTVAVTPGPGCDVFVAIPDQAVMGTFTDNALVYWMPGEATYPPLVIEVGKSYLVAGMDESGMFYQVLVSCEWVWVETDKVGPNYDVWWGGQALPTEVVE